MKNGKKTTFKYLLSAYLVCSIASSSSANDPQKALQKIYGSNLTEAPFALRYDFSKKYGEDWYKSTYQQREDYLAQWQGQLAKDKAKEKAEAKALAKATRQHRREKAQEQRKERNQLRQKKQKERAETKALEEQKRAFKRKLEDQHKELEKLRREERESQRQNNH